MRLAPYQIETAKMVVRDLLQSDTLHQRDAIAIQQLLAAFTLPTPMEREQMWHGATTADQRANKATYGQRQWDAGFNAGIAAVLGYPPDVEDSKL